MTSLGSTETIIRPLLEVSKAEIISEALQNSLVWHEDSTNLLITYRRNYVRHMILPRFAETNRIQLYEYVSTMRMINNELKDALAQVVNQMLTNGELCRNQFTLLPHGVSREVMKAWLNRNLIPEIDAKLVERLVHAAKTFSPGQSVSIDKKWSFIVHKNHLALKVMER